MASKLIRISGVTINPKKQIRFALTPVRGIGKSNVKVLLKELNIDPTTKASDLTDEKLVEIRNYIEENLTVEADLGRQIKSNIKHLIDIGSWRGARHQLGLPTRGQRTRTNSRTRRSNKRGVASSGKIKTPSKT